MVQSADEKQAIQKALDATTEQLLTWAANRFGKSPSEVIESVKAIMKMTPVSEADVDPAAHEAVRLTSCFEGCFLEVVVNHIASVSRKFPDGVFLLRFNNNFNSVCKLVIRAGVQVRSLCDHDAQDGCGWALPDIFVPFEREHCDDVAFGSLWPRWVEAMEAAMSKLKAGIG